MRNTVRLRSTFAKAAGVAVWMLFFLSACGLGLSSEERLERGQQAFDVGDYRAAIIDAKNILEKEPENVGARLLLGRSSIRIGDARSAEKELLRAKDLGASGKDVVVDLGRTLLMLGEFDRLNEEITIDLAEDEDMRLDIRRLHADARFAQGQVEEAREIYQEILALRPDDLDTMLVVVSTYVASDDYMQARATLDEVIALAPEHAPAWLASGSLHTLFRDFEKSEQDFMKAAEYAAKSNDLQNQVKAITGAGEAQLARGDLEALKATVAALEQLAPGTMPLQYLAARASYLEKDWEAASTALQNILRQDPNFVPAKVLLGAVQLYRGNLGQAEVHLSTVIAVMPSHIQARKILAEVQLRQNRADEAAEMLRPMVTGDSADPATLAMAARASIGSGEFDDAIRFLSMRSESDPDDAQMKMDLAAAHLSVGDMEKAEEILATLPELSDDDSYRREFLLVLSAVRNGAYDDALSGALEMQERWPDDVRVHNLVGGIRVTIGDANGAKESFNRARAADPNDIVSLINLARFHVADQEFDAATEMYTTALELQPDNVGVLVSLGQVAVFGGDSENAIHWLGKAREADATNMASRIVLGRIYVANRNFDEAERVAREAIAIKDDVADVHNSLGLALSGKEDHESAVKSIEKAVALAPEVPGYPVGLAREYLFLEDNDRAEELLVKSLRATPDHMPTAALLAYVYVQSGDTGQAVATAREFVRTNPNSVATKVLLGELLYHEKVNAEAARQFDDAIDIGQGSDVALRAYQLKMGAGMAQPEAPLLRYLALRPDDAAVRTVLAQSYQSANNIDAAVMEYEKILESDPQNFVALNNLAWLHFTQGNARAEELARRANKIAPENSAVADTLGWILVKTGSPKEGVMFLRKALDMGSDAAEIRYHLAVGLAESGERDEARTLLTEILAAEEDFSDRAEAEALLGNL